MSNVWRIWDRDDSVERRTYERVLGKLPEMECAKQLASLVKDIYQKPMKVLDVGCAAGHYYKSLKRIDDKILYTGVDATKAYIDFANNHFEDKNVNFEIQDVFDIESHHHNNYEIVFCCNVLLHLPSVIEPIKNLLLASKKYCFIRTLVSEKTHLSQYLYTDSFDSEGNPNNFVYENTYSYKYIEDLIKSYGEYSVEFIDDEFNSSAINQEFDSHESIQDAVTKSWDGIQIAGSKVFEWKWIKVSK